MPPFSRVADRASGVGGSLVRADDINSLQVEFEHRAVNADWFSDLNDAITFAIANGFAPVWMPSARTQTTPVTIPNGWQNGFRLWGNGQHASITYTGGGAFLTVDPNGTPSSSTQRAYWAIHDLSLIGPGSGTAGGIGLMINNSAIGALFDVRINGFEKGLVYENYANANGASCYYNDAYHVRVRLCKDCVTLQNGANSNTFHGGSLVNSERGVVIANANNVSFFGVDIESNTVYGADIDGTKNHFFGCRFENPSATKEIRFNDSNGRGIGNQVISFFVETAIDGAITWDANHDNLVLASGYLNLGSSDATAEPFVINGKRTAASDAEPFMSIADEYSSSGSPIGYQYTAVRIGSIGFLMVKDDGAGHFYPVVQIDYQTGGKPHLTFGDGASLAQDTNLYRNAANVLKTDDKLVAALGIGVGNSASASAVGTLSKKMEVFDASGASLGFVPIYSSIT